MNPRRTESSQSFAGPRSAGLLGPLGLSVVLHVGVGAAAVVWFQPASLTTERSRSADQVEVLDREKLGIDRSDAVTITWLGFATPTDHGAALSEVEQSELEIAETPELLPNAPTAASVPAEAVVAKVQPLTEAQATETLAQQAESVRETIETAVADAAATLRPLLNGLLALASRPTPTTSESAAPARPAASATAESSAESGGANRESVATTTETVDARPGQVVSAQGLEIITIRPKFPTITRMTAWPNNPEVSIEFSAGGRVSNARFQPGRSTGHSEVDQALLDAIYQWRARGPRIDALTSTSEPIILNMRILMR